MKYLAETLWYLLINGGRARRVVHQSKCRSDRGLSANVKRADRNTTAKRRTGMQAKYDAVVQDMLATHGIRVRKWRRNSSGKAWLIRYRDGSERRLLESPYPRGPMSCAIFLHEVGHHAIGFGSFTPRCLEEYQAWKWSLEMMTARGLNVTDSVHRRVHRSLRYAVAKARRRGLREVPPELVRYLEP